MRFHVLATVLVAFSTIAVPAFASSPDDKLVDQNTIAALEQRITQAQPREQCFLYAELIHDMTEFSLRQYASGDVEKATGLLKEVQQLAQKMHLRAADKDKRIKNAEILLRHTAFRLKEMLHSSSSEDRPLFEATLAQVNEAQSETMLQVFRK
jgi:hypothetical protein